MNPTRRKQLLFGVMAAMMVFSVLSPIITNLGDTNTPSNTQEPQSAQDSFTTQLVVTRTDLDEVSWVACDNEPLAVGRLETVAAAACLEITTNPDLFKPDNPNQLCNDIYGGPATAVVTGTINNTEVNKVFNRINSCKIGEWEQLATLLGNPTTPPPVPQPETEPDSEQAPTP